jgi:predicted kinase
MTTLEAMLAEEERARGAAARDALGGLHGWERLAPAEREALELAASLHAIGEAETRRDEDGRIRGPGMSVLGARTARRLLWEEGLSFRAREAVCALIRFQHLPARPVDGDFAPRGVLEVSVASRCDLVALLAEAIARASGREHRLPAIEAFRERAVELGCLDRPFAFPDPHSRFLFFRRRDRNPFYAAHDDTRGEVVILAGLPGSGKSTWISTAAPEDHVLVGLDEMREEMGVSPTGEQGPVVQAAYGRLRQLLGARGEPRPIVWNATNLSRRRREPLLALCEAYRFRARIVYVEVRPAVLDRQNQERERPVPAAVIRSMMRSWDVPDRTEAHAVEYQVRG